MPSHITRPSNNAMRKSLFVSRLGASTTASASKEDDDTLVELARTTPGGATQKVTLIGTAHVSNRSNEQVQEYIESSRPKVVMVELDRTRLHRIGKSEQDLTPGFSTSEDIVPPLLPDDIEAENNRPFWRPLTESCLDAFSGLVRRYITGLYDEIGSDLNVPTGGEFAAAIDAAQKVSSKLILGDRDSMITIRRAADLAIRSGNPFGVLGNLMQANGQEIDSMKEKVKQRWRQEGPPATLVLDEDIDIDEILKDDQALESFPEFQKEMVESIKEDTAYRNRLFDRLEREVPEFTRAFLAERDYIMAESIRREIVEQTPDQETHVVGVVGLAHVPGMAKHLYNTAQFEMVESTQSSKQQQVDDEEKETVMSEEESSS